MIVSVNDDFDLYKIAYSGQCFRVNKTSADTYRFITGENILYIKPAGFGVHISPGTSNSFVKNFDVSCSKEEWENVWFDYFDLGTSYADIRNSIPQDDKYLNTAANLGKGIRILRQDKFEMLISFIISQRKSIPSIKKSVELISEKYGKKVPGEKSLYFFPTSAKLRKSTESELKECGLGYRVPYIIKATDQVAKGIINLDELKSLSDEELVTSLKSFYGVGDKVANCVALFAYHRTGLAPVDTWIKKIMENEYGGTNPFPRYGENAGIMQQYMFYAAQHMKV